MADEVRITYPAMGERVAEEDVVVLGVQQFHPSTEGAALGIQYQVGSCPTDPADNTGWITAPSVASRTNEPIACDAAQWSAQDTEVAFPIKLYDTVWVRIGIWADQGLTGDPAIVSPDVYWWGRKE